MSRRLACCLWFASLSALAACGKSGTEEPAAAAPATTTTTTKPGDGKPGDAKTTAARPAASATGGGLAKDERVVYSLVDNRFGAHLTRHGGLVVPAGSAGFAKYERFGNLMRGAKRQWELRQTEGDVHVARATGKTASVFVPLSEAQADRRTLRARLHADSSGTLSVRVNDNKDINVKLAVGLVDARHPDPGRASSRPARTRSRCTPSPALELAWLRSAATPRSTTAARSSSTIRRDASRSRCPRPARCRWYVAVPAKAKLLAHRRRVCRRRARHRGRRRDRVGQARGRRRARPRAGRRQGRRASISASGCDARVASAGARGAGRAARRSSAASRRRTSCSSSWTRCAPTACTRSTPRRGPRPRTGRSSPSLDRVHERLRPGQRVAGLAREHLELELPREAQGDRDGRQARRQVDDDRRGRQEGEQVHRRRVGQRLHPAVARLRPVVGPVRRTTSRRTSASRAPTSSTTASSSSSRRRTSRGSSTSA